MKSRTYILAGLCTLGAAGLALYLAPSEAKREPNPSTEKPFAKAAQGKALFEEKCRTVAGEKIYRKVENVEGILLLKVRPQAGEKEWADPMWPGAAFANEFPGDSYIRTFLWFEHKPIRDPKFGAVLEAERGYVNPGRTDRPGYRYVDVLHQKEQRRYRYTGSEREHEVTSSILIGGDGKKKKVFGWVLDSEPTTAPGPRYAVTFEDHVVPEERSLGIASSTVKVIDTQTNEVIGELTRYSWSPVGPSAARPSPWLAAQFCGGSGIQSTTRFFVDRILKPIREK